MKDFDRIKSTEKMIKGLFELIQIDVPGQKLRIFLNAILDEVLYNAGEFEDNPRGAWEKYCKDLGDWWKEEMEAERIATGLLEAYAKDLVEADYKEFENLFETDDQYLESKELYADYEYRKIE